MTEEKHPCEGCKLFSQWLGRTECGAGLPQKRDDGSCYVGDD